MSAKNMTIRMDSDVKEQAQKLFAELGMDMTTAINVFLRQAIQHQRFPYDVTLRKPNRETLEAIAEVREMKKHPEKARSYNNFSELLEEVKADV